MQRMLSGGKLHPIMKKKTPGILKDLLRIREKRAGNNSLKKEAAKRLFGDVLYGSVTRFEQYVQCPFAFFAHLWTFTERTTAVRNQQS